MNRATLGGGWRTAGLGCAAGFALSALSAQPLFPTNPPPWLARPLSLADCLNLALSQNADVLKSRKDLEAAHGVSVQTRAIVFPKVQAGANYSAVEDSAVDRFEFPATPFLPPGFNGIDPGTENWSADIRLVQSLYEGGRLRSSLRTARLLREQALAQHNAILANTATDVRVAYYDVLLADQQIRVREASVQLLEKELEDSQRRFSAGTVPRFNVLRAEVELANARPDLSRARNAYRISKNLLVHLLGYHVPRDIWDDIPLRLSDGLDVPKLEVAVPEALAQALALRPELAAMRKAEELRREGVVQARAGYQPRLEGYVGYAARKSMFSPALDREVHGWEGGVAAAWSLFDGAFTRGRVLESRALLEKAEIEHEDLARKIELEVRTAYSTLVEAWEVRESQQKVLESAAEALRLARARAEAGTGTQLDVLGAQTALTEARTTEIRAKREYAVARARLERAMGSGGQSRLLSSDGRRLSNSRD
jgi:outer membrane protein TolC